VISGVEPGTGDGYPAFGTFPLLIAGSPTTPGRAPRGKINGGLHLQERLAARPAMPVALEPLSPRQDGWIHALPRCHRPSASPDRRTPDPDRPSRRPAKGSSRVRWPAGEWRTCLEAFLRNVAARLVWRAWLALMLAAGPVGAQDPGSDADVRLSRQSRAGGGPRTAARHQRVAPPGAGRVAAYGQR
jgi:hypothetical protein